MNALQELKHPPLMTLAAATALARRADQLAAGLAYLEIGTYTAGSLCLAALHTQRFRNAVIGIDPLVASTFDHGQPENEPGPHPMRMFFENLNALPPDAAARVKLIPARSSDVLDQPEFCDRWRGRVGMLFIDGEHTYRAVSADSQFIDLVALDGVVVYHDYNPREFPGVVEAVDGLIANGTLRLLETADSLLVAQKARRYAPLPQDCPSYVTLALDSIRSCAPPHVWLFGAGAHTRRVGAAGGFAALRPEGIVDDNARPGDRLLDLPVLPLEAALAAGARTIVISSDAHEARLLPLLRAKLQPRGIAVYGLYDEGANRRVGAHLARRDTAVGPEGLK